MFRPHTIPRLTPLPAAGLQILAPAKTVIENVGGSLDLKERESHLTAWGVKKASGSRPPSRAGQGRALLFATLVLPAEAQ